MGTGYCPLLAFVGAGRLHIPWPVEALLASALIVTRCSPWGCVHLSPCRKDIAVLDLVHADGLLSAKYCFSDPAWK